MDLPTMLRFSPMDVAKRLEEDDKEVQTRDSKGSCVVTLIQTFTFD